MPLDVVLGAQWGDEGKGKLADILCDGADICARCQGGNNAGHTVKVGEYTYDFHMLPSGLCQPGCMAIIGNGCVVHLPGMFEEIEHNCLIGPHVHDWASRLRISDRCHLVLDLHQEVDGMQEQRRAVGGKSLGTTRRGIGPVYASKAGRHGVRISELVNDFEAFERRFRELVEATQISWNGSVNINVDQELERYRLYAEKVRPLVIDTVAYMAHAIQENKKIIVEGANALMLDIDFGTYPFVTSSNTGSGGVCTGLGVPPRAIGNVYAVVKAYTTRVGEGAFPTEQLNSVGERLQDIGQEVGVTTKRKRRCGWLDLQVIKYGHQISGYSAVCLTKLDVLDDFETIKICTGYTLEGKPVGSYPPDLLSLSKVETVYITMPGWRQSIVSIKKYTDLPANARAYVEKIEELLGVPIKWVGTGPGRLDMINKP